MLIKVADRSSFRSRNVAHIRGHKRDNGNIDKEVVRMGLDIGNILQIIGSSM